MKTSFRSKRATTFRIVLVSTALLISTLTSLHAESTNSTQQRISAANSQHHSDSRPDWNVDYPSQLGPQGTTTSDAEALDTRHACDAPASRTKR